MTAVIHCLQAVERHCGVSMLELLGERRARAIARPRQVAMWLASKTTMASLPKIGRIMRRDHTTILHGIRVIEKMRERDADLRYMTAVLLKELTEGPETLDRSARKREIATASAGL